MIPIPEELLEQVERGNVLLFIGEHIVCDAAGQAVVDRLAAQLAARCDVAGEGEPSFPEAAQAYEDEKGRQALVQFLRDQLEALGDEPQRAHRLIAGLTDCDVLAATCLDRRLERTFEEAERPLDVVIGNVDMAFEDERKAQLYKLRGSVERAESLVLTEDDYETFFEDQTSISVVLQGYLARKTILFVGYDLADPHFKRLYRKVTALLDDYARRAYAFGEAPSPRVCRWCERHGIEVVEADATVFLEALTGQLAARARPTPAVPPRPVEEPATPLPERPYKLLDYYEARDAAIFFGRRHETQHLTSLIHAHRLVLLYGASGVGKTSLLLAGVVPRLENAEPRYETVYVRALEDPDLVIRRTVRRRLPEADLPQDGSLLDFLDAATKAMDHTLVIVLDQFEEFFIRLSPEFRAAFIAELGALYDARDVLVKVVLSLREDWLAAVGEIEKRIPEVFRIRIRLLPLTYNQARQAITAPVAQLGISYEPALLDRLLNDLIDSNASTILPPHLQLICNALFNHVSSEGREIISISDYEALGGTQGVLHRYLEEELRRLSGQEMILARITLEELVTSERTKTVATCSELALASSCQEVQLEAILDKLVVARLLRPLDLEGVDETAYELAHEYLINEITVSPRTLARKEAEELLRQGVDNWRRFDTLLAEEVLLIIDAQRDQLRLSNDEKELLQLSMARYARRPEKILFNVMGGLLGGLIAGSIGGVIHYYTFPEVGGGLGSRVLGHILVPGIWFGGSIALGVGLGEALGGRNEIFPIFGGSTMGMLSGFLWGLLLETILQQTIFGLIYGGGIALSIFVGRRFDKGLLIPIWGFAGAFVGGFAGVLAGLDMDFFPSIVLVGLGVAVAVGIAGSRFQQRR